MFQVSFALSMEELARANEVGRRLTLAEALELARTDVSVSA